MRIEERGEGRKAAPETIGYVRFWRGFLKHLAHFRACPAALIVYDWALLSCDHRSGRFVADRREIGHQCGLPSWQVKKLVAWLSHGRGCACCDCSDLPAWERPAYIQLLRSAHRGAPPIYRVLRHDSQRDDEGLVADLIDSLGPNDSEPPGGRQIGDNLGR